MFEGEPTPYKTESFSLLIHVTGLDTKYPINECYEGRNIINDNRNIEQQKKHIYDSFFG